jgi:C1A family cysteine protease
MATLTPRKTKIGSHGLGWKPDLPDMRDQLFLPRPVDTVALPAEVRLDETDAMPGVYNQGQLGSCTANGSGAAVEYDLRFQGLADFMPSRLFIYYWERYLEGTVDQDSGAQIRDAVKVLAKYGAPPESDYPYDIAKFTDKPTAQAIKDAAKTTATSYARVTSAVEHWKAALAAKRPIIIGFTVYESFEDIGANGIMPMPSMGESVMGGHCVLICGYAMINGQLYYRLRNSWGSGWADSGYCWLPATYITTPGLASDFWVVSTVS